ncbi:hypothetical protein Cch01nite_01790 [Cellulomonas chitinilytica]|uniref:Uncharacterized protein n=1 Tax=Cellulomonas chitinilytica TaxID=398759 RepID=A0A919NZH3_9CELL|nr:hypothetical protein [Cellulomonas chitinilytica]GIG19455.1 hypothetical protein Cch01nite_01790 [Cellulomonas chitinilytica]
MSTWSGTPHPGTGQGGAPGTAQHPGTVPQGAALPLEHDEVLASWWWWTDAARAADEPTLALALDDRRPAGPWSGPDPAVPDVLRARDLLLVGRLDEADVTLDRAARAASPTGDVAYPQLVLSAVRAARRDDQSWSALLGSAASRWPAATVAPLVAAAADARGDRDTADRARVAAGPERSTGESFVRTAVAALAARPAKDAARLGALVAAWADRTLRRRAEPDVATALVIADALAARGDRAGARLLLHAVDVRVPANADVRAAAKRLTPSLLRYWVAGACAAAVLAATALVAAMHGDAQLMRFVAPAAAFGFLALVRAPGLTRTETSVWRELRTRVYDEDKGGTTSRESQSAGWYMLAVIAGGTVAVVVDLTVVASVGRALSGDAAWATSGATLGVFVVVGALGVVAGALGARAAVRAGLRRRRDRRAAAEALARSQAGSTCRCTTDRWVADPLASDYAAFHLVTWTGVAAPVPGGTLQRCPRTGTLWLTGPVGAGGRTLALSGRPPGPAVPQPYRG